MKKYALFVFLVTIESLLSATMIYVFSLISNIEWLNGRTFYECFIFVVIVSCATPVTKWEYFKNENR